MKITAGVMCGLPVRQALSLWHPIQQDFMLFWIKLIVLEVIAALSQENYECWAFLTRVFTQNWVCSPKIPLNHNR